MKLWTAFYDLIVPDVPGCPLIVVDFALRQATILFCEQSLAWRYQHPDIVVTNGFAEYPYAPPAEAVVHAIIYAEFNGREISAHTADSDIRIWDWRNQTGTPDYVLGLATSLTLVPMPDLAGTLKLTVALKPSPTAIGLDDDIYNEYRGGIIHGALARLMLSPKKPYTDGQLAAYHQQQFTIAAGQAGTRQDRNYTRAALRTDILSRGRRWV